MTPKSVKVSSSRSSSNALKLFDGDLASSFWESANESGGPHWVEVSDFGGALSEFSVYVKDHGSFSLQHVCVKVKRGVGGKRSEVWPVLLGEALPRGLGCAQP